jgi:hypothetical protein
MGRRKNEMRGGARRTEKRRLTTEDREGTEFGKEKTKITAEETEGRRGSGECAARRGR